MSVLAETMRQTIRKQALLQPGDRLLVAVSGGPDSLALLHALNAQQEEWGVAFLAAAHLDHGLRGEESQAEADFVQAWCAENGIECIRGHANVTALRLQRKETTQEAARSARYAFLEQAVKQIGANKIATGHTQDDQVETILLNILRGAGLDGLRGIPYRRGAYIRPLRDAARADVTAYCAEHALNPRCDPSNQDPSHYTRNRIRLELLPLLENNYQPAVRKTLLRLAESATRDADYLHQEAERTLAMLTMSSDEAHLTLDARRLRALHPALLRHVLRAAFAQMRGTALGLTHEHLEPICEALLSRRRLPFGITAPAPRCTARVTERRLTLRRLLEPGERQV